MKAKCKMLGAKNGKIKAIGGGLIAKAHGVMDRRVQDVKRIWLKKKRAG